MDAAKGCAINETLPYTNVTLRSDIDDTSAESFWSREALHKIAPVLFVMATTIIGNLVLIILLAIRKSRRRKRVNVFIVNLAIADLTVAFITMTTELLEAVFKQWVLGAFLCKFLLYFQVVTLSSTTFLLTGMSIDRYQMIARPLKSFTQRPKIKAKVVLAWFMAFVFAVPQIFIFVQVKEFKEPTNSHVYYCKSAGYSSEWQRKFYFTFLTFYILLLPAGIMSFCYTAIARAIWNRGDQSEHTVISAYDVNQFKSPRMSINRNVITASRRKVVFMTLSVIIAYIVCLTPYFIICLIRIYSHYSLDLRNALTISQIIFMLHSALNPILYGLFTLRAAHVSFFCSLLPCKNKQSHKRNRNRTSMIRNTHLPSIEKGTIFCWRKNTCESSVIIAHHAAMEESSFKLRNHRNRNYVSKLSSNYLGYNSKSPVCTWSGSKDNECQSASINYPFPADNDTCIISSNM